MKLVKSEFSKDGEGFATVIAEDSEDLWHAYNLIVFGDKVKASTFRKVQSESSTGSRTSEKVKLTLTLGVEKVDFDPQAGVLRLGGKNTQESKHVKLGQYHTLEVETHRPFTLHKECWDSIFRERLDEATNVEVTADVGAVVMSEGLAHVCLVTSSMTILRAKVETSIPKKRGAAQTGVAKATERFYNAVMQSIIQHFDFAVIKCVILASPGFTKDECLEHMLRSAQRSNIRAILENRAKFLLCHSSSGEKYALGEVLRSEQVHSRLADTKAAGEVQLLEDFERMLGNDPDRAFYGPKEVTMANEKLAVKTLLITDTLFRSNDIATRKKYVQLVESVRDNGGDVRIFSSLHVSGERENAFLGATARHDLFLLYGPPGTGKTLLARAVAHHTECCFIRVSGSELVQKYIGEGSRMVRELFVMAREHAPSIIFMDEIDSIGSSRVEGSQGGDSEVQRTMLELLNQLDGFEATQNIKILMATNRIDILDPALLRPGRIDRKIEFPNPNESARADILRIHSRKMNLMRGINLKKISEKMSGASGAESKAVCTEAGMFALRERRVHVTQEDFELAVSKVMRKDAEKNTSLSKLFK